MLSNLVTLAYTKLALGSNPIQHKLEQQLKSGSDYYTPLTPSTNNPTIGDVVDSIITLILYAAGIAATIYLLWAGIQYITSAGDEGKATKARQGIVNAVIGIIVIVLAFVLEKAVAKLFT